MEIIHQPPTPSSFTPLSTHQSQTPSSFYSGRPILHHHSPSASLFFHASDLSAAPALSGLANGARRCVNGSAAAAAAAAVDVAVNGHGAAEGREGDEDDNEGEDEEFEIERVDVWVTSERLILFSPPLSTGLSIPYPCISLHALQHPSSQTKPASLFLQLLTEAQTFDDHDPDATVSVTIVPAAAVASRSDGTAEEQEQEEEDKEEEREEGGHEAQGRESESQAQRLFAALSACANLHPDPVSGSEGDVEDDDEGGGRGGGGGGQRPAIMFEGDRDVGGVYPLSNGEGAGSGLPPPMPGSGGWITAENVGEFFDEEGNWRGGGGLGGGGGVGLGEGAGTVRTREEDGDDDGDGVEGEGGGTEETKWRRTE